jgi:hypothetical protein
MRLGWAGRLERMGEMRNTYKLLVRKTEGERLFWGPRYRWKYNI